MKLLPAFRAQAGYVDLLLGDSGGEQLPAIGLGQIQVGFAVQIIALRKPLLEAGRNLGANLEAAGADGGADGGMHAGQLRAHGTKSLRRDFPQGPPPARVHGGHPLAPGIDQQKRQTIGRFYGDEGARRFSDEGIALAEPAAGSVDKHGHVRMDLVQSGEAIRVSRVPGAKAVFQKGKPLQRFGPVNAFGRLSKH